MASTAPPWPRRGARRRALIVRPVTGGESGTFQTSSDGQAASVNVPANLTSVDFMQIPAAWAEGLARALLADSLSRRWSHVQGVAARARTLKSSLGTDADLLEAAAW